MKALSAVLLTLDQLYNFASRTNSSEKSLNL